MANDNRNEESNEVDEIFLPNHRFSMNGAENEYIEMYPNYDWGKYTVIGNFRASVKEYHDRPLMGSREKLDVGKFGSYKWKTYSEVAKLVDAVRDYLHLLGIKKGDMVAIYGHNREEWLIADLACCAVGAITVPLYDALGVENLLYISKLTELKAAFVDHKHAPLMLSLLDQLPCLKHIVSFDGVEPQSTLASTIALYCERNSIQMRLTAQEGSLYSFDPLGVDSVHSVIEGVPGSPSILSAVDFDDINIPAEMPPFTIFSTRAEMDALEADCVSLTSWSAVLTIGAEAESIKDEPTDPEATFSVMFSSGTTGNPKGVVCRNISLGVAVQMASANMGNGFQDHPVPTPPLPAGAPQHDVLLSYLPLAHVFERAAEHMTIHRGDAVGYSCGNIKMIVDDLQVLRPTIFIGVPRVFVRMYNGMQDKINSSTGLKRKLLKYYLKQRRKATTYDAVHRVYSQPSRIGLALIYSKFRGAMGGRVRQIWSGSAPIPGHILRFFKEALCIEVHEGYGLTETMAVGASTMRYEGHHGHNGVPGARTRVKVVGVPGRYTTRPTDDTLPRGEVCIQGPCVTKEYYKNPELTASTIDSDGFFHTGDVGEVDVVNGATVVRLIGRLKNVLKLQQGEFVNLDAIDAAVRSTLLTAHVTLARGTEPFVIVFCTVDVPACRAEGFLPEDSTDDDLQDPGFRTKLLRHVRGGLDGLRPFEMPRHIHVCPGEWTPDDMLTPSMKVVRSEFEKRLGGEIDEMYRNPLI